MNKIVFLLALLLGGLAARAEDPTEIMKKTESLMRVETQSGRVKLTTGTKGEIAKIKVFDSWRKLKGDGIHYNTLTRFTEPADIKGEAVLLQENPDNQNNVFIYLPTFRKTRRVEGYDQGKSFMGTVFSYSDVTTFHYTNYKYRLLKKEKCAVVPGDCYVIEAEPRTDDIKKRTRYSKSIHWVGVTDGLVHKTDAYDIDGPLEKHILIGKYKQVHGGKWIALKVHAERVTDGKFSTLDYSDPQIDQGIDDNLFTEEGMAANP